MTQSLSGIFIALATPFKKERVSLPDLKSNIEKYNRFDLAGYVVLGSTGEGIMMSEPKTRWISTTFSGVKNWIDPS